MGKKLVIVESPAKAKTINKILGDDFVVKASFGHVRDLPEKKLGVDIANGFKPEYITLKGKQKVLQELRQAADDADAIYLAPDPDREGEAIAWHLQAVLQKQVPADQFFRVSYNEITAPAIRHAFENPGKIDMRRVESQQARRILDRIVGYKVSPLLWRRIPGGSSAGRVQSVALRLVCEREQLITDFVKEKYWVLGARLRKLEDPRDPFEVRLFKVDGEKADIKKSELAEQMVQELAQRAFRVKTIARREIARRPRPPYITSSLQQAASSVFGYSPARTMSLAQKLYEGGDFGVGLITYMRTDSFSIAKEAQQACLKMITESLGAEYCPEKPNFYKSRASAQEAHEAIRPTDVNRRPETLEGQLSPEELKLYRLIWQRFVASQMAPARIAQQTVDVDAVPATAGTPAYLFRASASQVLFPGYMKVTGMEKKNGEEEPEEGAELDNLPPLREGEDLERLDITTQEKETQPPPRYTEASLIKALEENGVGRPSTYATIISTIINRKYVLSLKKTLKPTPLGGSVNTFLVAHLDELFDVHFTAGMEESLDEIEKGTVQWTAMLQKFYQDFTAWVEKAKGPAADTSKVQVLLKALEGVKTWAPEQKRGARTYSDQKFTASIARQVEQARSISTRQFEALARLGANYRDQIPDWPRIAGELAVAVEPVPPPPPAAPAEDVAQKLEVLKSVQFDGPRRIGKRTFDDRAFYLSLCQQVDNGRQLTERQVEFLDRLLNRYAGQLGGSPVLAQMEAKRPPAEEDVECPQLLDMLAQVKVWREPFMRGKMKWDDQGFFTSLKQQFGQKKTLSPKQKAALKKLLGQYADQIADFDAHAEALGLKRKTPAAAAQPQE